ncbi:MAG: T9SS type A sorting domain-containing protein [FCB group bacterium]
MMTKISDLVTKLLLSNPIIISITLYLLVCTANAQPKPQDTSDIIWQKYIFPQSCGDAKFSPNGNYIYAALDNHIVKLSAQTGDSISTFEGELHIGATDAPTMDISALGNYIVTRDYGPHGMLWDCKKEKLIKNFTDGGINTICISPDEKFILFNVLNTDSIVVYDPTIDKEIFKFKCRGSALAIKFNHDGTKFAIVSWYQDQLTNKIYNSVTLWETGTWKQISEIYNKEGYSGPYILKFSYDDLLLGFVGYNTINRAYIYNINTNQLIKTSDTTNKHKNCYDVDFLPDNIHWFFFYASNIDNSYSYDYYNYKSDIIENKYQIHGGTADCDKNTNKVLVNGMYWLTMLKPTVISVKPPDLINEKLNIIQQSGNLTIELTSEHIGFADISISDLLGKNIEQQKLGFINQGLNRFIINANLPNGIYICKISINDYSISQKFQISK